MYKMYNNKGIKWNQGDQVFLNETMCSGYLKFQLRGCQLVSLFT